MREFLTTRRARITPDQVGLPTTGSRRVPGLRRSEVATLAGLSVEYYARLERGQIAGASSGVLDALARALQLDETERAHLFDLARAADGIPTSGRPRRRTPSKAASRLSLQWALEAITDGVAFVRDPHQNLLATNALGRAFYSPVIGDGGRTAEPGEVPVPRPRLPRLLPRLGAVRRDVRRASCAPRPAATRTTAALQDLVGELSTRSEIFRRLWADHNVRTHGAGTKRFHHPVVGELTLAYEELAITAEPGLVLMVYTAEPGSPSAERLRLLASWAATTETADRGPSPGQSQHARHTPDPARDSEGT